MRRLERIIVLASSVVLLTGCLTRQQGPGAPTGEIQGQVLAGPVCPVERPGQIGCEPKPVAGSIDFIKGGRRVGEARLDSQGKFSVPVPLGTYTLHVRPDTGTFPACPDTEAIAVEGETKVIQIDCDTGIR